MAIISGIIAVANAIPVIDKWLTTLFIEFAKARRASMKQENIDAIRKALQSDDQRDVENILSPSQAGEASNAPGSVIVDSLPGVHNEK